MSKRELAPAERRAISATTAPISESSPAIF
jgi:hypothetical protein